MSSPTPTPDPIVLLLDRTVDAPRAARERVRAAAAAASLEAARADDAVLLVSELVTNAVKYGGDGRIELLIEQPRGIMRVAVRDKGGPGPLPEMREPGLVAAATASDWSTPSPTAGASSTGPPSSGSSSISAFGSLRASVTPLQLHLLLLLPLRGE